MDSCENRQQTCQMSTLGLRSRVHISTSRHHVTLAIMCHLYNVFSSCLNCTKKRNSCRLIEYWSSGRCRRWLWQNEDDITQGRWWWAGIPPPGTLWSAVSPAPGDTVCSNTAGARYVGCWATVMSISMATATSSGSVTNLGLISANLASIWIKYFPVNSQNPRQLLLVSQYLVVLLLAQKIFVTV